MSIRKRPWTSPDGTIRFAWQVDYRDQNGKRRAKQFTRKKDAEQFELTASWQVSQGTHTPDRESITIAQAAERWLASKRADNLEPTTLAPYEQHVRLHINPVCGKVKLSQLTLPMIERLRDRFPMATRVFQSLKAIIAEAMRLGFVAQNVAVSVKIKKQPRRKAHLAVPPKEALRAILQVLEKSDNPAAFAFYSLAIFAGLRASELRGLTWSCVTLENAKVRVSQRADFSATIGEPKSSAGHRVIPLPSLAIRALKRWQLACPPNDAHLIFPSLRGLPMGWGYLTKHIASPIQLAAGQHKLKRKGDNSLVMRWNLHSFRHAAASLWNKQGANPKQIQYWMGHSSIQVTFDTYGHLFEQADKDTEMSAAVERALFGNATRLQHGA